MTRFISILLLGIILLGMMPAVWCADLPVIEWDSSNANQRLATYCSIAVRGQVTPAYHDDIRVRIWNIREDGKWISQGGVDLNLDAKGHFAASIQPPGKGWLAGKSRVEVQLAHFPQVKNWYEFQSVRLGDAPAEDGAVDPTVSSGIVVDLDQSATDEFRVPEGQSFIIRGTFAVNKPSPDNIGEPSVSIQAFLPAVLGGNPMIIAGTASGYSIADGSDRRFFEAEMTAPPVVRNFRLRVVPRVGNSEDYLKKLSHPEALDSDLFLSIISAQKQNKTP